MTPDPALLERLRQSMSQVQERHERDQQGAARAFWESLAPSAGDEHSGATPGTEPGGDSCRGGATGSRRAGDRRSRAGRGDGRRGRRRGPRARANARPRTGGAWAHVSPGEPIAVHPLDVAWAGPDAVPVPDDAFLAAAEFAASVAAAEDEAMAGMGPGTCGLEGVDAVPVPGELGEAVRVEAMVGMSLVAHGDAALRAAVEQVASARADLDVALVNTVAELETRGVEAPDGLSRVDWLRSLDPTMSPGQAKAFLTVARAIGQPRWRELAGRISLRHVTVAQAAHIVAFEQRTGRVADPREVADAVADLLEQAPRLDERELAQLARHHAEQVTPPADADPERVDAARESARGLWFAAPNASGMVTMRGVLDPEAAAILKAAVDPLSVPCPEKDKHGHTVAADPRPPEKRRADALVEVVQRGVAASADVPVTDKTKVVVTIDFDTLAGQVEGTGLTGTGEVLSPATVRRMACDAAIIPMVLGGESEPLDVGRRKRLVTGGLRQALIHRDGGCTFPGCTIPAQWTDAHHVLPWYLGGKTSLLTCALLCRRHHTYVHRQDLTATVTATGVTWHV